MHRLALLLVWLFTYPATAQTLLNPLLKAEQLQQLQPLKAIGVAEAALTSSIRRHDYSTACLSALFLGSHYRKSGNYKVATYYDSLSVAHARLQPDVLLKQKAANSYTHNFLDQLLISKTESLLEANKTLLTAPASAETCRWYEMKALCYLNRLRFDSAILSCRTAMPIALQLQDSTAAMHLQMLMGKFYTMKLRPDSVYLCYEALHYFERNKDYRNAAQAANIIGFVLEAVNSPGKAILFYEKALGYNILLDDAREAMQTRMNIGDAYLAKKEEGIAKTFFNNGLRYYTAINFDKGIAAASIRLGRAYTFSSQYDSAWYYFKMTEQVNEKLQLDAIKVMLNGLKALLMVRQNNKAAADSMMEEAVRQLAKHKRQLPIKAIQKRLTDKKSLSNAEVDSNNRFATRSQQPVAEAVVQASDYQRLEKLNWHTGGVGSIDSSDLAQDRLAVLQTDASFGMPQLKDSLQTERKEKLSASQQSDRHLKLALIATGLLLLVAAGLWLQYKSRRRAEQDRAKIEELQAEIHHRVTNNLGVINAMVEMAAKASASQLSLGALKTRIDSVALVHRLLYSGTAATGKISLQLYFEALSTAIAAIFEREKAVQITIDAPVETDSVLAEKLGLIVNELITNSFKYAFAGKESGAIHLYARLQTNELYLTVADNGMGLPAEAKKGQGSKLIKGLCHQLKGSYRSENKGGAFFEMTVPV